MCARNPRFVGYPGADIKQLAVADFFTFFGIFEHVG